jgi:hypothetical protein
MGARGAPAGPRALAFRGLGAASPLGAIGVRALLAPASALQTALPDAYHRTDSRKTARKLRRDVGAQSRRGGACLPHELPQPINRLGTVRLAGNGLVMGACSWLAPGGLGTARLASDGVVMDASSWLPPRRLGTTRLAGGGVVMDTCSWPPPRRLGTARLAGNGVVVDAYSWLPPGSPTRQSRSDSAVSKPIVPWITKTPLYPASAARLHRSTAASPGDGPARLPAVP